MAAPTTAILDSFTRAGPALGANWTSPMFSGDATPTIASNKMTAAALASSYWAAASFGADQESYLSSIAGSTGSVIALCRGVNMGTASFNAYAGTLDAGNTRAAIWTIVNNSFNTQIAGPVTGLSAITGIWLNCVGTTLTFYTQSAGVWTQQCTVVNALYSAGGSVGVQLTSGLTLDDFGGGTIGAAASTDILQMVDPVTRRFW